MAYKLKFTGATATATIAERIDLASSITLNANTGTNNLRVEIEFELDSLSATNTLCFAANFCRFQILNTGQISVQYRNQTNSLAAVTSTTGVISVGVRYVLALELSNVDRNARIFLDGVQVGIVASRWGTFTVDRLGLWPENSTFNGSLYRVTCYQNNVIVNDYNPSTVLADPNILVDEIGGNNGTMVNFPSDGSARVPYDDGGGSEDQDITIIAATQPTSAAAVSLSTGQVLNLVPAQHLVMSTPVNIAQAQGVLAQTANQVVQSTAIAIQAEQQLSTQLGEQFTVAVPANIQLSQELSVLTGEQLVTAQLVNIDQSGATDVTVNPASQVTISALVALSLNQQVSALPGIQVTNAQAIEIGSGKPAMVIEVLQGEQLTASDFVTVQIAQNAAAIAAQQLVSASAVPLSQALTLTLPEAQQRTLAARIVWGDKVIDPCKVRLTRKRSDFVLLKAENTFILNRQRQDFILRSKCNV